MQLSSSNGRYPQSSAKSNTPILHTSAWGWNTISALCSSGDFTAQLQWLMPQWIWSRNHKKVDLWHPRLTRSFHGQTDAEFVWNNQTLLQKSWSWFYSALPPSQCTLFPEWVQEQHMQDFHNMSWVHNPNLPEMTKTNVWIIWITCKTVLPVLFHLHGCVWQEIDFRFSQSGPHFSILSRNERRYECRSRGTKRRKCDSWKFRESW